VTGVLTAAATTATTLGVTGTATFTAASVHNGGIDVNAASDISSLTVSGTGTALTVDNNASVSGTLAVTGSSTFTGLAQFTGGIDVDAASDISSLTVSGTGTSLTVTNSASMGALQVAGASTITGLLTLPGGFDANASTASKLTVDGGDATTLIVNQGATVGGAFAVAGASTFTGASTHSAGILATSGTFSTTLASTLGSGTGLAVAADSQLTGDVRVGAALVAGSLTDNLSVTGGTMGLYNNSNDVLNGDIIGSISAYGVDYGESRKGAEIRFTALGGWSNGSPTQYKAPTRIQFFVQDGTDTNRISGSARFDISADTITHRAATTITGVLSVNNALIVTGTSTLAAVNASGVVTLSAVGTALSVTNAASVGDLSVGATSTLTGAVTIGSTLDVADTVSLTKVSGTGLDVAADAVIGGTLTVTDLHVTGTTTTIDTATLSVEDHNIELGVVGAPTDLTADGGGITLKGTVDKTLTYDNTNTSWDSSENMNILSGKEYRIDDISRLTETTVYLGVGAGDGQVVLGDSLVDGSWKIDVDGSGDLRFSKRVTGGWVTKQTIG
jgi:hypothetical protein